MIDKQEPDILSPDKKEGAAGVAQEAGRQENKTVFPTEIVTPPEVSRTESLDAGSSSGFSEKINPIIPAQQAVNLEFSGENSSQQQYLAIEKILEEDLGPLYAQMSPQQQQQFRAKGEEVTRTIFKMVYQETKVKVKKIIILIKKWLKLIPGINKYFLEQEAKIKTDRIVEIASKEGKRVDF